MTLTTDLHALALVTTVTALMWLPYILERLVAQGLFGAMGNDAAEAPVKAAWADRARRAHRNAVENLVVFAPLVLIASMIGATNATTAFAAQGYLVARVVHYVVYVLGVPGLRTLAFVVGLVCTLTYATRILGA